LLGSQAERLVKSFGHSCQNPAFIPGVAWLGTVPSSVFIEIGLKLTIFNRNRFELGTATKRSDGLRLLMSPPVDAIVLEHHLDCWMGAAVAAEIRKVAPQFSIVMLAEPSGIVGGSAPSR
jgi:hypothetical protein